MPAVRHGRDDHLRTIEAVFTDATAPGLARQPHFVHDSVFAEVDSRDAHGFPRRGGFYRAAYALWNDRTLDEYDFRRLDIVGSQFISLSPQRRRRAATLALTLREQCARRSRAVLSDAVRGRRRYRCARSASSASATRTPASSTRELRHKVHPMAHVAALRRFRQGRVTTGRTSIRRHVKKRVWVWPAWRERRPDRTVGSMWRMATDGTRVFLKFTSVFLKFEGRRSK